MSKTTIFQTRLRDFDPVDGGGLNLTVRSGRIRDDNTVTDKADQTVALTDNSTNFVEIDNLGVATRNTVAFTAGSIAIATVVTAAGVISSVTDKRAWIAIGGGGGSLGSDISTDEIQANAVTQDHHAQGVNNTTTTSNTPVLLDAMTLTFTPDVAVAVLMIFAGVFSHNTASTAYRTEFQHDGATLAGTKTGFNNTGQQTMGRQHILALSAASHTLRVVWSTSSGTVTGALDDRSLSIMEFKR